MDKQKRLKLIEQARDAIYLAGEGLRSARMLGQVPRPQPDWSPVDAAYHTAFDALNRLRNEVADGEEGK